MANFRGNPAAKFTGSGGVGMAAAVTADALPVITAVDPNTGDTAGDETVTVWGTGFLSGDQVTVDGNATTETFVDTGKITFVTPADAAGTYDVLVVRGGDNSNAESFEYVAGGAGIPGDAVFFSDWLTATGTSDAAIRDTDKTVSWDDVRGTGNEVIVTGALDFPTTNVYKATAIWRGSPGAAATGPDIDDTLTGAIPSVGDSIYYRVYVRIGTPDAYTADVLTHPYQDGPGQQNWQFQVITASDGTWSLRYNWVGSAWPNNNWRPPALNKNQTYRVEHRIHRLTTTTANLHVRVYTSDDVLLYADADFKNSNSSSDLGETPTFTFADINRLKGIRVGMNGLSGGDEGDFPFTSSHWGALAMRKDDWCGPFAGGF